MGTLSSYAHALMVIHFLLVRPDPVLVCVQHPELVAACAPHELYEHRWEGYHARFCRSVAKARAWGRLDEGRPLPPVSTLLGEYFHYWTHCFDTARHTATVRHRDEPSFPSGIGALLMPKTVWGARARLWRISIEDPFECHDAVHGLRRGGVGHDLGSVLAKSLSLERCVLFCPFLIIFSTVDTINRLHKHKRAHL
jgi:hypothetical protein